MNVYRDDPEAIGALVCEDRVHRDLYISGELFALEQERLFAKTWIFAGHTSQIPHAGDYRTLEIAGRPLLMLRHGDDSIHLLMNRCAHKGAMLASARSGNTGRVIRCPYHDWSYRTDGSLIGPTLKEDYEGTAWRGTDSSAGLSRVTTAAHRGFVFARLAPDGIAFEDYFGPMLKVIDKVADRSPEGELEVAGEPLRTVIRCNWKMYLENINDNAHVPSTHESSAGTAQEVWDAMPPATEKPMGMEQILPFGSGYEMMKQIRGLYRPNGHSIQGLQTSLHTGYTPIPGYNMAMRKAHGEQRAAEILGFVPQNTLFYPSMTLKAVPQSMRVVRPLAAGRTLVETWAFRARGAPDELLERTLAYNRLVFAPTSLVAHDDVHVFESIQRGLHASGNEWVSMHRGYSDAELNAPEQEVDGTNEALVRNQFRAWKKYMAVIDPMIDL